MTNAIELVAYISALLPQEYWFEFHDGVGRWSRDFDDGTEAWIAFNYAEKSVELATMDYEPDDQDAGWVHRNIECLPEMAAVALRCGVYGLSVLVSGSEYASTREGRAQSRLAVQQRLAEREAPDQAAMH